MFETMLELSLVSRPSGVVHDLTLAVFESLSPLSSIGECLFACSGLEHTFPMSQSILDLASVSASIRPNIGTLSIHLVVAEVSFERNPIPPQERPVSIQDTIFDFSLVDVTILEPDLS